MPASAPDSSRAKREARKAANKAANTTLLGGMDIKYIYGLVFAGLLGTVAILQFLSSLATVLGAPRNLKTLDITEAKYSPGSYTPEGVAELKDIFFAGKPHVLYCTDDVGFLEPIPQLVKDLARLMNKDETLKPLNPTTLQVNCFKPLPTNQTIAERFNFGKNANFLAVFGEQEQPLQLNYLTSADQVMKQIKPMLSQTGGGNLVQRVVYLKDFERFKKVSRSVGLLYKTSDAAKGMAGLLKPHQVGDLRTGLKVFGIDSSFYHLSLDPDFVEAAPVFEDAQNLGQAICFVKDADASGFDALGEEIKKTEDARDPTASPEAAKSTKYIARYLDSWDDPEKISKFLNDCYQQPIEEIRKEMKTEIVGIQVKDPDAVEEKKEEEDAEDTPKVVVTDWVKLVKRPRLAAIPSETKHMKANAREGMSEGEKVGQRMEEEEEDDLEDDVPAQNAEEQVEDIEL